MILTLILAAMSALAIGVVFSNQVILSTESSTILNLAEGFSASIADFTLVDIRSPPLH